ncbi:MAG TPA: hypothetical protein GXX39_07650 [Syntrophothermus lipocalidus]|nr:hypothetical protein [Syntrophothermus lipocalidus]
MTKEIEYITLACQGMHEYASCLDARSYQFIEERDRVFLGSKVQLTKDLLLCFSSNLSGKREIRGKVL